MLKFRYFLVLETQKWTEIEKINDLSSGVVCRHSLNPVVHRTKADVRCDFLRSMHRCQIFVFALVRLSFFLCTIKSPKFSFDGVSPLRLCFVLCAAAG